MGRGDSDHGVAMLGGLSIFFLVILVIIAVSAATLIRQTARVVDENLPAVVDTAQRADQLVEILGDLGPQTYQVLDAYAGQICTDPRLVCPTPSQIIAGNGTYRQCTTTCAFIVAGKQICNIFPALSNNTICTDIILPLGE